MQAGPTKSVVHEMESKGAACLGLVCDSDKQNILPGMVGVSAYYPVHMAVLHNHTHAEDSVQLFGRLDKLPGYAHISLSPTSNQQKGVFLLFFTTNIALGVDEVTLAEIAIEFPENHPKDVFSLEAFLTRSHAMDFTFATKYGLPLAWIHYSIDGLVKIVSDFLVLISPMMRKDWLPKRVLRDRLNLSVGSNAEAVVAQRPSKRARLV
jgi:hypothetical protein